MEETMNTSNQLEMSSSLSSNNYLWPPYEPPKMVNKLGKKKTPPVIQQGEPQGKVQYKSGWKAVGYGKVGRPKKGTKKPNTKPKTIPLRKLKKKKFEKQPKMTRAFIKALQSGEATLKSTEDVLMSEVSESFDDYESAAPSVQSSSTSSNETVLTTQSDVKGKGLSGLNSTCASRPSRSIKNIKCLNLEEFHRKMASASPTARVGTPKKPDPKLYEHLSEKEKMLQGWPHQGACDFLTQERAKVHKLTRQFNDSATDDVAGRREILRQSLNPSCKDLKNIWIEPPFRVDYGYNTTVGEGFYANFDCVILDSAKVTIGKNCLMAPGVHIYTATHPVDPQYRHWDTPESYELAFPVTIGDQCWIGGKSIICPGVTIGDNVVIGAGSVVTKDVPSNVVVAGNPAKIIRYLDGAELPEGLKK